MLRSIRESGRTLLTEAESKQVLAAYGIPTVGTRNALTEDEAVQCARGDGLPVVVKLFSKTHDSQIRRGRRALDIRDADGVRHAWRSIAKLVGERAGPSTFSASRCSP